eukprot:TRINITY_DN2243_c0_g1_i3.p1 TRINITY_DN2243_c0_g1~~TRINITY_DN2243_c0_g1_i3.p1  ORF type:complete len:225 (+),score=7.61 TRINITY_DN2243_c0_g1_i3:86-760(+)
MVSWLGVSIAIGVGGVLAAGFAAAMQEKEKKYRAQANQTHGNARVGGPFVLMDHNGKPRTDLDFRGKFMLIYFGFTYCPDICPTELKKMAAVYDAMEKTEAAGLIQPLFITVDPMRDSVGHVREYLKEFHPSFLGLTGTPTQVEQVCKAYRVYYSKAWETAGEQSDDDYLVDHSVIMYLMDPKGDFLEFYGTNLSEQEIVKRLKVKVSNSLHPNGDAWWKRILG